MAVYEIKQPTTPESYRGGKVHTQIHTNKDGQKRNENIHQTRVNRRIEYSEGFTYETTSNITPGMTKDLLTLAEVNTENVSLQKVARRLLPMTRISAAMYAAGHPDNTPLYISHTSQELQDADDRGGIIKTQMRVVRVGRTSINLESEQRQGNKILGRGTDILLVDPYPYVKPEEAPTQSESKPKKPEVKKEVKYFGEAILLRPIEVTQEKVDTMAHNISGDNNKAHTDPEYMKLSRFNCGTISHGMMPGIVSVISSMDTINALSLSKGEKQKEVTNVSFDFLKPVVVGEAIIQPELRRLADENNNATNTWEITLKDRFKTSKRPDGTEVPVTYIKARIDVKDSKELENKPKKPTVVEVFKARINTQTVDAFRLFEEETLHSHIRLGRIAELQQGVFDRVLDPLIGFYESHKKNPHTAMNNLPLVMTEAYKSFVEQIYFKPLIKNRKASELFINKAEIGVTPKTEVTSHGLATLYHYESPVPKEDRKKEPLMLVFARMNRPTVMDIAQGRSFVEYMTKEGYDVYLMDWGKFNKKVKGWEKYKDQDFDDDVLTTLPKMVDAMKKDSGADQFSMLGWCQGAVLTAMYAAVQPEIQPNVGLKNIITLTPPFNYPKEGGALIKMANDKDFNPRAYVAANDGVMPGANVDMGAKMRDMQKYLIDPYKSALDIVDNPKAMEGFRNLQKWMRDLTDLPGPFYISLVEKLYRENQLVRGKFTLKDRATDREYRVNLKNVKRDVLVVGAKQDDIAPPIQWEDSQRYFGGKTDLLTVDAGHIGLMVGKKGFETWKSMNTWLSERSTEPKNTIS